MYQIADNQLIETLDLLTVNNNNNRISIAPYGRNHVVTSEALAAGRTSVPWKPVAWVNKKSFKSGFENRVDDENCF